MPDADERSGWARLLPALRVVFLVVVVAFAWLGLRGRFDEVLEALRSTPPAGMVAAVLLVVGGLELTGLIWLRMMACAGARLPLVDGMAVFFVGQLGKYIPGSVWSIGAQAHLAGRHAVPARATVTAGLLFLGYHVATAVVLGTLTLLLGGLESPWPPWVSLLAIGVSLAGLAPAVVRWAGGRVAGRPVQIGWADTLVVVVLMGLVWTGYALALVLLAPGLPWDDVLAYGGAFAVAYAAGVVVVLAPAGAGARETILVVLLAPLTGVAAATALALLARVVHTVADAASAAGWWFATRRSSPAGPTGAQRRQGGEST